MGRSLLLLALVGCRGASPAGCRSGHVWVDARLTAAVACVPTQRYVDSVATALRAAIDSLRPDTLPERTK